MILEIGANLSLAIKWTDVGADIIKFTPEILGTITGIAIAFRKTRRKLMEAWFFSVKKWKDLVFFINLAKYVKEMQATIPDIRKTVNRIEATLSRNSGKSFWDFIETGFNDIRKEIRQSNARIKVTENIAEETGIFFCDTSLRWLNVNEAITDWTDLSDSKLLGYGWKSIVHDNDLDFVLRHMKAAIDDNREDTFNFRLIRKIGYEQFSMMVTPTLDENRNVFSLTGTIKKI